MMANVSKKTAQIVVAFVALIVVVVLLRATISEKVVAHVVSQMCGASVHEFDGAKVRIRLPNTWYLYSNNQGRDEPLKLYGCINIGRDEVLSHNFSGSAFATYVDASASSSIKITFSNIDATLERKINELSDSLVAEDGRQKECIKIVRAGSRFNGIKCSEEKFTSVYAQELGLVVTLAPPPVDVDHYLDSIRVEKLP